MPVGYRIFLGLLLCWLPVVGQAASAKRHIAILELRGLHWESYRLEPAIQLLADRYEVEVIPGWFKLTGQSQEVSYFPATAEALYRFDLILFLDVDTRVLSPDQVELLCQYVQDGGGVAFFGGWFSFGASNMTETPLAPLLPVTLAGGPFTLQPMGERTLTRTKTPLFLKGIKWPDNLTSPWLHAVKPAAGATVLAVAGDIPWLAAREAGTGRLVTCAGTVLGEPTPGRLAFYDWPEWPKVMAEMVRWLARK